MRKLIALGAICLLLLIPFSTSVAGAETKNADLFTQAEFASSQLAGLYTRQIVKQGDTLYAYLNNAAVYSWGISDSIPHSFCQLPEFPEPVSTAYCNLESEAKAKWDESVSFLATGDNALWGVNVFAGKIGKITEDGIQWDERQLDVARLMPDGYAWPLRVVSAFVTNNTLYTYVALDNGPYPQNNYEMLTFDLTSGSCKVVDIKNAQGVCAYKFGTVLLLYSTNENTWIINVMDLATGIITDSPFHSFPSAIDKPIGGLAFDPVSDRLFFTAKNQVWGAAEGEPYMPMAFVPVPEIVGEAIAFTLEDGRYALFYGCLYVRGVDEIAEATDTLHLQGCIDQTIYESFASENPNIPVDFSYEILSPDEIVQALVTGDQTSDLYAVIVNHTFKSIVQKGYTADLSSSAVLSTDIQAMYTNIQRVITDQTGNPVAYPYMLLLSHWQVNEALWRYIFGDEPIPSTFDQFMDAMVLWENTYADEYPEINFSGNFDHAYWVRTIVNAFAQQYGQTDSPLDLTSPILRSVLEKLEQVRDIRKKYGRNIDFIADGEFFPFPDIFIIAGFNNVLLDPIESQPHLEENSFEDAQDGMYIDMPALVFREGAQPLVPGEMIVWFVNPYSQHKELAIRYLEHAARMENNFRVFYATHPDANEPLAYEGYAQSIQEKESHRDELKALLNEADGDQRVAIENALVSVENWLSNTEKEKWIISEKAIAHYRAFAPFIRFFEDNTYITPQGSAMLQQLDSLYQRYANGTISLDNFISELDRKMGMLYLESK